jgi:hypothetical protein
MSVIDEQIKDAMRKGQFANLPGTGKPLKLDDDAHTPENMRMAHKLMRDNEITPEWMTVGKEIDAAREKLVADIKQAHRHGVATLRERAKKLNSQILSYNLKVPQGVVHKRHVDFDAELKKAT